MASALVTRLALSRVLGSTTTRTRPRLTCYWSRVSHRVWAPDAHYSSHPKPVRFAYVRPRNEVRARLLSSDDIQKTIFALDVPLFALDVDVRTLFEESNFPVARTIMYYDPQTGWNNENYFIVPRDRASVTPALQELHNAPLFNRRLKMETVEELPMQHFAKPYQLVDLRRGWFANDQPDLQLVRIREPLMAYPNDLFAPLRESRRLAIDNMPDLEGSDNSANPGSLAFEVSRAAFEPMYSLFSSFDVAAVSRPVKYVPKNKRLSGWIVYLDLAAREDVERAILLNGSTSAGRQVIVARAKIPMKYTVSWDSGRPSGHNKSDRDSGSAVGTNFEYEQEKLFRTWVLAQNDRKLWVPNHEYRRDITKKPQ